MSKLSGLAHGRERGSMPLALLASIVVGALMIVIVSSTMMGQRTVRFDRDFTEVVQVADAGIQDALVQLNGGTLSAAAPPSGDLDGIDYTVEVVEPEDSGGGWRITSTATLDNGVRRRVVADTREVPLFGHALFARNGMAFNGANYADSYTPEEDPVTGQGTWCTGRGLVGTDAVFNFNGGAPNGSCHAETDPFGLLNKKVTVDGANLYDCGDLDAQACRAVELSGTDRCVHSGGDNCKTPDEAPRGPIAAHPEPFRVTPESEVQQIVEDTAVCEAAGWSDPAPNGIAMDPDGTWRTKNGDVIPYPSSLPQGDFYCVKGLAFEGDTTVERGGEGGDQPVRIYVKDAIRVTGTGTRVNCPGCTNTNYRATTPDAARLRIMSIGASTFELRDPQIQFAAAVYVPNAACAGPAGADLYGSVICGLAANVGNWAFHYDDTLQNAGGTGLHMISHYREEPLPRAEPSIP